jgi:hypothetical protein
MSFAKLRAGEWLALAGAACVIVSLFLRWYERPSGALDAWDTFGPALVLLLIGTAGALWLFFSTLAERSTALPVAAGAWSVALGLLAFVAALVRVLERPEQATGLCAGAWLALAGAVAMLLGAWLSIGDERGPLYPPARPPARPAP